MRKLHFLLAVLIFLFFPSNLSAWLLSRGTTTQGPSEVSQKPGDGGTQNLVDESYPGGNIMIQLTQNGLNKLLTYLVMFSNPSTSKFTLNVQGGQQSLSDVRFVRGPVAPKVEGQFASSSDLEFRITLPKVDTTGNLQFSGQSRAFTSSIQDLSAVVQVSIRFGPKRQPEFYVKNCNGIARKFSTLFKESSPQTLEMGALAEASLIMGYKDYICHGFKYLVTVVNGVFFDLERRILTELPTYPGAPLPNLNMSMICGPDQVSTPPAVAPNLFKSITDEIDGLSLDLTMNGKEGFFNEKNMVIGLRGDFLAGGNKAKSMLKVPMAKPVAYNTDRHLCISFNETFVNSFLIQAFKMGYFNLVQDVVKEDIPAQLAQAIGVFCPGICQLHVMINGTEPPIVDFRLANIKGYSKIRLSIFAKSADRIEKVVEATIDFDVIANVRYDGEYVKSNLAKGGPLKIQIHHISLPNLFDKQPAMLDLLSRIYNNRLWPRIDANYKKMLEKPGIRLPIYCGIEYSDRYTPFYDGVVSFCFNFFHHFDKFMVRYNAWRKDNGYL